MITDAIQIPENIRILGFTIDNKLIDNLSFFKKVETNQLKNLEMLEIHISFQG